MTGASPPEGGARPTHLLYLHGFRSSPASFKARRMAAWLQAHRPDVHWWCPQLPPSPAEAWALIRRGIADWPGVDLSAASPPAPNAHMAVVGSSLGGFYATVVAEATGCRAVVLNPSVNPARSLAQHLGTHTAWHDPDTSFTFTADHIAELQALRPEALTRPDRYSAVFAKGDEVLDWRDMVARYDGATIRLLDGGDHALSDFDDHLPFVLDSLSLTG